jgi:hypothetical protein
MTTNEEDTEEKQVKSNKTVEKENTEYTRVTAGPFILLAVALIAIVIILAFFIE